MDAAVGRKAGWLFKPAISGHDGDFAGVEENARDAGVDCRTVCQI
jgi:hypothetical protein